MFTSETPDEKTFAGKPMNCPGCVQVFNQGLKLQRFTFKTFRFGKFIDMNHPLHGLLRVRAFTQDDAYFLHR